MLLAGQFVPNGIISAIGFGLLFLGAAIAFAIVQKLTLDFVVPIMFLRRNRCLAAWRELGSLISGYVGTFILYFLFQIVLAIAIAVIVFGAIIITCCIAGCLMLIPYVGTVLLLPVLMFKRCYSLYFLAQFGRDYDVFPPEPPSPPGAPPVICLA
jgi:hypothetical protein